MRTYTFTEMAQERAADGVGDFIILNLVATKGATIPDKMPYDMQNHIGKGEVGIEYCFEEFGYDDDEVQLANRRILEACEELGDALSGTVTMVEGKDVTTVTLPIVA